MTLLIGLLRGINVGGKNALPMKDLVALLESVGASHVRTYIQSGNTVFRIPDTIRPGLEQRITDSIRSRFSFEPHVLLIEPDRFRAIIRNNPFSPSDGLHIAFLSSPPPDPHLRKLESLRSASERFCLTDQAFYLDAPEGGGRSKLASGAEKAIGVTLTDRNWKTVSRILELLNESESELGCVNVRK